MRTARNAAWFCLAAVGLLAFLFRDAWLHGYVLGQSDFLFDYLPWQGYRPAGWRVRNPLMGDPPMAFYPFLFHARAQILSGHFPLWSSSIGAGQPFFAAMQTAVLSPFSLLDYILPFPASFTADVAARLFVGGAGMYCFLRALPVCHAAAMFGGVAYLLNPFSIVWLEHPQSAAAAFLPWLLLTTEAQVRRLDRRSAAASALVVAGMLFAGHPETAFKAVLLAGAYASHRGASTHRLLRSVAAVAGAMALGAVLASIQLLPFQEYLRGSRILAARGGTEGPLFTLPGISFVTAFVPDFYGTPLRHTFLIGGNYCEQQIYAGLATWVLAAIGLVHQRHRGRAVFFLAAATTAALIMYGTPIARVAIWLLPPLRVAALSRFGFIAIVGLSVAGAIGLDGLCGESSRQRGRRPAMVGTAAAAIVALVVVAFLVRERSLLALGRHWQETLRSAVLAGAFLAVSVGLLFLVPRLRRVGPFLFPALLAVDLLVFADGFHPLMPRALVFPPMKETSLLQADPEVFRIAGWMDAMLPNTAVVYGLRDFRGFDGIGVREYMDLLDVGFHFTGATHQLVNVATPHLIDLLNIKYILTPASIELPRDRFELLQEGTTRVYLNHRVQPRAFLTDEAVVLKGNQARRAMRDTVDLTRVAVVETELGPSLQPERANGEMGRALLRRYRDDTVSITTRANGRRLLVLTDVFYPGWIATVDGVEAPIHRVDFAFRGVSIPAGEHLVEFRYRPASVRHGLYASLTGVVMLIGLLVLRPARISRVQSVQEVRRS